MDEASAVLDRFAPQIRWITESVRAEFELPECDMDDLRQDAVMLVLSYAGLIPGIHFGKLIEIESKVNTDQQATHMIARVLRLDLGQMVSRTLGKIPLTTDESVDDMTGTDHEPSEESHERELVDKMDEARLIRRYPMFARHTLDGITQEKLAAEAGCSVDTVQRRIAGEKRSFLLTLLKRRGIIVEGDETMSELEEAYSFSSVTR